MQYSYQWGLYGGVANNLYVFAKALDKQGKEICFIRDRSDRFAFSQPSWEDVRQTMSYQEIQQSSLWEWSQWQAWEEQANWSRPDWLVDPLDTHLTPAEQQELLKGFDRLIIGKIYNLEQVYPVLHYMRKCQYLLVCGVEAEILAYLSGRPFLIWPHGRDLRLVDGRHPPAHFSPKTWLGYKLLLHYLKRAYRHCLSIGTHDPLGMSGHFGGIRSPYLSQKISKLPFPLPVREPLTVEKRLQKLDELNQRFHLNLSEDECLIFVPSRLDYYWKGHQRLIEAILELPTNQGLHFIFSGWGVDYPHAKEALKAVDLNVKVSFLSCSVSKPLLYDFFQVVDMVIDQFILGAYGTAALEAMSCACPVMMWIDDQAFKQREWLPPPVIKVQSKQNISTALHQIGSELLDLKQKGLEMQNWLKQTHLEELVLQELEQFLAEL